MVKKLLLSLVFTMLAGASYAQTIVSTSPQNKNVVLEEFTGIGCVWCPSGHAIAKTIQDANPDRVSLINIHVGGYATPGAGEPDFRTSFGSAIVAQTGILGYPSGTINRHVFAGNKTILDRDQWAPRANQIMEDASPVNVAVEASIDVSNNILTVHVEGYYTSNSPESTNLLNVVLLQNNTKGPQTGGGQGNNYNHMHRLVEMITGQWGEVINTTTAGTFVDRTYTYTIPADYKGVPTVLEDMEVVAFVSNTHQEIPTGMSTFPNFTGLTNANDASIVEIPEITPVCSDQFGTDIVIKNMGADPLTSLAIEYIINGQSHTYNWTGNVLSLKTQTVSLPAAAFTLNSTNTLEVNLPNDDDNTNNSESATFDQAPLGTGTVKIQIITDSHANEFSWELLDSNGTTVESGDSYSNTSIYNIRINLPADCYSIKLSDTGGDGGTRLTMKDVEGTSVFGAVGNWGGEASGNFSSNGVLGTNSLNAENISLYPNPASTVLNLKNAENANIQVFDVLGKMILSMNNLSMDEQIDVSKLQTGTYFMKISKDNNVTTKRFLISK